MPARQFTDSSSVTWEVFEVRRRAERTDTVSPGLESGWLTFIAGDAKRRLAVFPDEWWSFSDAQLEVLCRDARPSAAVIRSAPRGEPAMVERASTAAPPKDAASAREQLSDDEIRALARQSRGAGLTAVQAMLRLKRLLTERAITAADPAHKAARRLFVETFYFGGADS